MYRNAPAVPRNLMVSLSARAMPLISRAMVRSVENTRSMMTTNTHVSPPNTMLSTALEWSVIVVDNKCVVYHGLLCFCKSGGSDQRTNYHQH